MRPLIYLAAPLSIGDPAENVQRAIETAGQLRKAGYAVINPILTYYEELAGSHFTHTEWLAMDFPMLARCDALLRLPGESVGADQEVAFARVRGIPVFLSIEILYATVRPAGDDRFLGALMEMWRLHRAKSSDYGSDEDVYANIRASAELGIAPWIGAFLRGNDKLIRIKQFIRRRWLACEGVTDSLLDFACYALIALILFREEMDDAEIENACQA